MAGSDTPMTVMRYDVPYSGIHNLYLGLWADAGILGLASFLGVVGWQVFKTFRRRYPPMVQWGLVALILVVLGDSVVKHSLIYDMDGVASYLMIFLLPMSPALVDQG
jgi:O-antigen ligase